MSELLPRIFLVRHGETEWSVTGQHTGSTDLPLTPRGDARASLLRERLKGIDVRFVWSSPLQRARRTCELAGFGQAMTIEPDLTEWAYGDYEGRTTADIRLERPNWSLFRDGCPNGENADQVGVRADRLIARIRDLNADILLFGHNHMFRVLAARWLGLPPRDAAFFQLAVASVSVLSFEHTPDEPVISLWNDISTSSA